MGRFLTTLLILAIVGVFLFIVHLLYPDMFKNGWNKTKNWCLKFKEEVKEEAEKIKKERNADAAVCEQSGIGG